MNQFVCERKRKQEKQGEREGWRAIPRQEERDKKRERDIKKGKPTQREVNTVIQVIFGGAQKKKRFTSVGVDTNPGNFWR